MNNFYVADDIERINRKFLADGKNYVLIGPGRWSLQRPLSGCTCQVAAYQRSSGYRRGGSEELQYRSEPGYSLLPEPHLFGVGYFTVDTNTGEGGFVNKEILDAMPAVEETQYVRHVRFEHPMRIRWMVRSRRGAVLIPKE